MKRYLAILFTVWILFSAGFLVGFDFNIENVRGLSEEPIYIRADGSIDPPDAPIITLDNITYSLTESVKVDVLHQTLYLKIERSNITFDGNGYAIEGDVSHWWPYQGTGVELASVRNVTIKNTTITGFGYDIELNSCTECSVCQISLGFLSLQSSSNNNISGNMFRDGLYIGDSSHENTIEENILGSFGRAIVYLENVSDLTVRAREVGQIFLLDCRRIKLEDLRINGARVGMKLIRTSDSIIDNCTVEGNLCGLVLKSSTNNKILNSDISSGMDGVIVVSSSNNTFARNNISGNNYDDFHDFFGFSIILRSSNHNEIYHNNFYCPGNPYVNWSGISGPTNTWNNDGEGNYWGIAHTRWGTRYIGTDFDRDGIGDLPHDIDENSIDYYPLMGRFQSFNTSIGKHVNVISNSSVQNFEYFESNSTIRMQVSTVWNAGFCRISIPKSLIKPNYIVTLDCEEPLYVNYLLHDNCTHRWIYFTYENSTREIVLTHSIFGDLNNDRTVDMRDIGIAAFTFGSYPDHPRWNPQYDFNEDSEIDLADLLLIAKSFGAH